MTTPELVTDEATYPESPRWHEDKLWFSDVHAYAVKTVDRAGTVRVVAEVPGRPAGLGFLPDGSLLVASALDRKLWRQSAGELTEVADLSGLTSGLLNDMVVDARGRAFVGDTGFNLMGGDEPRPGQVLMVDVLGGADPVVVCDDVMFPNGAAISDDGHSFWLAESVAHRVTHFELDERARVLARTLLSDLPGFCDGLCIDRDDNVWVALLQAGEFWQLDPAGRVLRVVSAEGRLAVACVLGGDERRDLYLCSAATTLPELAQGRSRGMIHRLTVQTPGAGRP